MEFTIVIVAKSHNPSILNPDFLKHNEIIPADWELSEPPICTEPLSQVSYKNGIKIIAQLEKVIFFESVDGEISEDSRLPSIASKYMDVLPHVDYRSIGINLSGHVIADSVKEAANFVLDKLISSGPWKDFQESKPDTRIQLGYPLPNSKLNLSIQGAQWSGPSTRESPVVLFGANFHHDIGDSIGEEKISNIKSIIQKWPSDFKTFRTLVEKHFLS